MRTTILYDQFLILRPSRCQCFDQSIATIHLQGGRETVFFPHQAFISLYFLFHKIDDGKYNFSRTASCAVSFCFYRGEHFIILKILL